MPTNVLAREIAWLEPVAALEAVRGLPWPVLLDSARADARLGRWSYVAADPFLRLTSKDGRITLGERSFTGDRLRDPTNRSVTLHRDAAAVGRKLRLESA